MTIGVYMPSNPNVAAIVSFAAPTDLRKCVVRDKKTG